MKYCLIDMSHLIFRARFVSKSKTAEDVTGFAFHIAMHSMLKVYQQFGAKKMIACFDGGSWRKDVFPAYKGHRGEKDTPADTAIKESIFEMLGQFYDFLQNQTNALALKHYKIEADDFINHWITSHPDDEHVILSSDSDFRQLIAPNVELFDGMGNILYRVDGIFYQDGKNPKKGEPVQHLYNEPWKIKLDKKDNPAKVNPSWYLFEKIMKGDVSDNIPRVLPPRYLTKDLMAMFESPTGEEFNTMMAKVREDLDDKPAMIDLFLRNASLIDMSLVPDEHKHTIERVVEEEIARGKPDRIGMNLLMFCRKLKLNSVAENAQAFANMLAA